MSGPDDELHLDPEEPDPLVDDALGPSDRPEQRPARRRSPGGVLGAAMLGLQGIYEPKPKQDIVVQVDASGDPPDIDRRGLDDDVGDDHTMSGPPLDDLKARAATARGRVRRPSRGRRNG